MYTKVLRRIIFCFIIIYLCKNSCVADVPKSKVVKCAVCRSLVYEIHRVIREVDPRKTVEVGSFRINPDGQQERLTKKYSGSEAHMTELLESICQEFKDYVQARHKETNEIEAIKLVIDGKMNPRFDEYEMIQDPDLNKRVQFHCESIVEDFEDDILEYFSKHANAEEGTSKEVFCTQKTKICPTVKHEL